MHQRENTRGGRIASHLAVSTAALLATLAAPGLHAQTTTWNVNGDGSFNVDSNWDTGLIPTNVDSVVITNPVAPGSAVLVEHTAGTRTIADLTVNAPHSLRIANATLVANGANLSNNGTVLIDASGRLATADLNVSGNGQIQLAGGTLNDNGSTQNTLTQQAGHTIRGFGSLGGNTLGFNNLNGSLVSADVSGQILNLDPGTTNDFSSQGTVEAINDGILRLTGSGNGEFDFTGGLVRANGAGSTIELLVNANVTGGNWQTTNGGTIQINGGQNVFASSITLSPGSTIDVSNNADFEHFDAFTNRGVVNLNPIGNASRLGFNNTMTLNGGGTVVMNPSSGSGIASVGDLDGGAQTIVTNANNTFRGAGNIGGNLLGIVNQANGLISADLNGETILLDPGVTHGFVNQGTLQAVNGGTLTLTGSGNGSFDNAGGTIFADVGSEVRFQTNAVVNGGLIQSEGGVIRAFAGQNVFWNDVTTDPVTNVQVDNNADLEIADGFNNQGSITLNPAGNNSRLGFNNEMTLTGSGTIHMNPSLTTGIASVQDLNGGGQTILTNANNTIRGAGNIGSNNLGIVNQANGLISADIDGQALILDPGVTHGMANQGTLQAVNGATLTFTGSGNGSFTNTGGLIRASGVGSEALFVTSSDVIGGTLRSQAGGILRVGGGQDAFFTNVAIAAGSTLNVDNNADFEAGGTINNAGTINLNPVANGSRFMLNNSVTLTGGGTLVLNPSGSTGTAQVSRSSGTTNRLTLANQTIRGAGNLGSNLVAITVGPNGQIIADNPAGLNLDPVATATDGGVSFINQGLIRATNNGALTLSGSGNGSFVNQSGATIDIDAGATLFSNGIVTHEDGATLNLDGTFNITGGNFINQADDFSPASDNVGVINISSGRFTNEGTLNLEINGDGTAGVDYDTIIGTGSGRVTLGGTLDFDLNFNPNFYETFALIETNGSLITDRFDQLAFNPIIGIGEALAITYRNFNRFSETSSGVLLTRALPGDANLNGSVEQADLDAVLGNWGSDGQSWETGDFNGNGTVEQADLDAVLGNWGSSVAPNFRGLAVPEPAALTLIAGLALLGQRRSRA